MKNIKGNLFVLFLVIFILMCGFMLGEIYFSDNDTSGGYLTEDGDVINNVIEQISSDDFLSLFVGKYSYEKLYDEPAGCKDYQILEIKLDGTYTYSYGGTCAGGWDLQGKYSISKDKIYLFNDNCKYIVMGNECSLPNCSRIEEFDYTLIDGELKISSGVELVKEK